MIDANELAICKRRGHDAGLGFRVAWARCKWRGTWLREVRTIEEREDTPPEDQQSNLPHA
jgi:hypothetical protein